MKRKSLKTRVSVFLAMIVVFAIACLIVVLLTQKIVLDYLTFFGVGQ